MRVDTEHGRLLQDIRPGLTSPCFVWSSDQRHLACESWSDSDPSRNGIYPVRVRDLHLPVPCGGAVADPISNGCAGPVWSPPGRLLFFQLNDATGSHTCVCDADGGHPHEILDRVDGYGDWGVHPPQSMSDDEDDAR